MKFKKVVAQFDGPDLSIAEELICDIFFAFKLKGVICDIPLDEPDEGFGTNTLEKPTVYSITGFLPHLDSSDLMIDKIRQKATDLSKVNIHVTIQTSIVDEKDWEDAWKDYFEVTKITDRIIIRPDWKEYTAQPGELVIDLDPGMAFGTGTHPTTAMCLKLMDRLLKPEDTFLDIGTGSGILMIAAAKLKAAQLLGIDNDPVATTVAKENLLKNNVEPGLWTLDCATLDQTDETPFDFIAANIIAQVIVEIMPDIAKRMAPHTTTLLSGIIRERQPDVMAALTANNLEIIHEEYEDEWVALAVARQQTS